MHNFFENFQNINLHKWERRVLVGKEKEKQKLFQQRGYLSFFSGLFGKGIGSANGRKRGVVWHGVISLLKLKIMHIFAP